jgi:ferredoxin
MSELNVTVDTRKCQAYAACLKTAPTVFRLGASNKAEVLDPGTASDETVLLAAKNCPYRAITVVDGRNGTQLYPRPKP